MNSSYSIVIRTLGNTGEKYSRMLESINALSVRPEEVIVVIPEGYALDHQLGWERVVRSKKGMVTQRAVGIDECHSDYMLVLDDDIVFPSDFVEKMHDYLVVHSLDCVLAFGSWSDGANVNDMVGRSSIKDCLFKIRGAFTGQYFTSSRNSSFFDVITYTAGHKTFINSSHGLCQTGCFQCFYVKTTSAKAIHFIEDIWLEQGSISSYAAYDDAVFFYKLFKNGGRIAYSHNTDYKHLDAASGRPAKSRLDSKRIRLYTIAKNRLIFWKKYIYCGTDSLVNRIKAGVGGVYWLLNYSLYNIIVNIRPRYWDAIKAMFVGYRDAFRFLKSIV